MISRPSKKRSLKSRSTKFRRTGFLGGKFKPTLETLEERRVLAAFAAGDLVVYTVGNGSSSLVSTGSPVFMNEFTPSGTAVQSVALPTTASGSNVPYIDSGTATSAGELSRSADGQYLVMAGYDRTLGGSGALTGTTSASVPRVVGRVSSAGTVDTSTYFTNVDSSNNVRGAASNNGTAFWISGAADGVDYGTYGTAGGSATKLTSTNGPSNVTSVEIAAGQLYAATQKSPGTLEGVDSIGTGLPTSGQQTPTRLPGLSNSSPTNITNPDAFVFAKLNPASSGNDTLYVADDAIGVTKFSLVSGTWVSNGVVGSGSDTYFGLTASVVGSTVTLYATRDGGSGASGGGQLVSIVDTSGYDGAFSATPTVLATAPNDEAYRGVAFTPVASIAAPVVTTTGSTLSYNEAAGPVAVDPGVTVTSAGTNLFGATVSITSNYASGEDSLGFTNQNGITGSFNSTTGVLTLLGTATVAHYQTALQSVTYTDNSYTPSTATRTVSFVTYDSTQPSNTATRNITVNQINQTPVNTVPGTQVVGINGSFAFTSANGNLISVSDVDSEGGVEQVALSVTSGTLLLNGTTGLTITNGANSSSSMTIQGTLANIDAALNGMTYSAPGSTGSVTLTIVTNDLGHTGNGGAQTATSTVTITVNSTPPPPPVVTTNGSPLSYTESSGAVAIDPSLTLTDTGVASATSATVTVSGNYVQGEDVLGFTNQNSITDSFSASTGVLSLSGIATIANYQTALQSVTYTDSSQAPSTAARTISFVASNSNGAGSPATFNINVISVNNAPVNTVPTGTLAVTENASRVFSSANGNAFSIADVDAEGGTEQFTLNTTHGAITLSGTTGLTGSGNGTAAMTYTGTLAAINAALNGLTFTPTAGFSGTASIQLIANDLGHTGTGGSLTDTTSVNITVISPAPLLINEIMFNPPGPDIGFQWIELRSTTNGAITIPSGTYLVGINGNASSTSGMVTGYFDLSGMQTGSNGILLLVQNGGNYDGSFDPNGNVIENQSGTGFGNNAAVPGSSDMNYYANGTTQNIPHASETYMLIQAPVAPQLTDNIDPNHDGVPFGGGVYGNWTVLDSVGILASSTSPGDYTYGQVNFVRSTGDGQALTGTNVDVDFTADYVARTGNTTGWASTDWVADNNETQSGTGPIYWSLSNTDVSLPGFAGLTLNTLGGDNFPGILSKPVADLNGPSVDGRNTVGSFTVGGSPASIIASTAAVTDSSSTTLASATVTLTNDPDGFAESLAAVTTGTPITASYSSGTGILSLSGTATLAQYQQVLRTVTYNDTAGNPNTTPRTVDVVLNDGTNTSLTSTSTVALYNPSTVALLNEIDVNPPGTPDQPYEYIELRGTPGATLNNYYVMDVDGTVTGAPGTNVAGTANIVVNLTGYTFGSNGLMVIKAASGGFSIPAGTTVVPDTDLNTGGVGLTNGTCTFMLVFSPTAPVEGTDYDANDTGTLSLPANTTVLDNVGWQGGGANDVVYGGVTLTQNSGTPDAATRFSNAVAPSDAGAWYCGGLVETGSMQSTVAYDGTRFSANFPAGGASITPGATNYGTLAAPVVTTTGSALSYSEGEGAVDADPGVTVTDASSTTLASATITISANYVNGEDVLGFTNQNGITGSFNAGSGTMTLTGTATVANYQTALESVTYTDTSGTPSTAARTVTFVANDGTLSSTAATRTINLNALPVADLNGPSNAGLNTVGTFTVGGSAVSIIGGTATVSDESSSTLASATVTLTNDPDGFAESLAAVTAGTPITASYSSGTGILSLSGTATLAQYQQVLRTVTYNDTSGTPNTTPRTVNVVLNDGTNTSVTSTSTVALYNPSTVALLNEMDVNPPGTPDQPYEYIELRGTPGATLNDYYVLDVDGTVSGAPGTNPAGRANIVVNLTGYTFGSNGLMVITAASGGFSIPAGTTVVPDTDLSTGGVGLSNGTCTFMLVFSPTAPVEGTDYDANDTGTLTLPANTTVLDNVGWQGGGANDIVYGGVTLTQNSGTPDAATRFSNDVTPSTAAAWYCGGLVETGSVPSTVAYDGTRISANFPAGASLTPGATNYGTLAAPVVTTTGSALSYTEGAGAVDVDPGVTVTDADSANLVSATITISGGYVNGEDVLGFGNQNGITGSFNAGSGTMTLTGSATVANYQTALESVTYTDNSQNPTTAARTVSFVANDGTLQSSPATRTINVISVNNAPVVTVPGAQTVNENTNLTVNGISVSDVDSTTSKITLSAVSGTVTLSSTTGLTFSSGANGTSSMVFTGTIANINTALSGLVYRGNNNFSGSDTITLTANDQGNTGIGGPMSATGTINVTVNAVVSYLVGDMNGDGAVNNFDIGPFELALASPSAYLAQFPTLTNYQLRGDVNNDGSFDNFDIGPFETLLATGHYPSAPVGGDFVVAGVSNAIAAPQFNTAVAAATASPPSTSSVAAGVPQQVSTVAASDLALSQVANAPADGGVDESLLDLLLAGRLASLRG